jgi:hypothetical protein
MASWDVEEALGFIKQSEADDVAKDVAKQYGFEAPFPIPGWTMHTDTPPAVSLLKDKEKIINFEKNFPKYQKIENMLGDSLEYSTGNYKMDKPILDNLLAQRDKYKSSKEVLQEGYEILHDSGGVGKRASWDVMNNELLSDELKTKLKRGKSGLKGVAKSGISALPYVGAAATMMAADDAAAGVADIVVPGGVEDLGRGSDTPNVPESEFDPKYNEYLKRLRRSK